MLFWTILACTGSGPTPAEHGDHAAHGDPAKHGHDAHGGHGEPGHGEHASAHHRFDDPEKWAEIFDDPERDAWQKPAAVVAAMGLEPGMVVADIGAGTGYFNPHLAGAVGPEGRVIAVDIEPSLVDYMVERAKKDGTPQVEPRLTTSDRHGLKEAEVDRVLLVDTYHHIGDRPTYFSALRSAMKEGGRLIIVDLTMDAPFGPPKSERLTAEAVTKELVAAGWARSGEVVSLPHQYVVMFE